MTSLPADDHNPFAPPETLIGDRASASGLDYDADAELIRRHHLSHESSIKAVGLLCYLVAIFGVFAVVGGSLAAIGAKLQPPPGASAELMQIMIWVGVAVWATIAVVGFALGYGLRGLQAWARWLGIVFTAIALMGSLFSGLVWMVILPMSAILPLLVALGFAVAIQVYVFYLLVAPKANMVFSGEYHLVTLKTPEIRSRTSLIVKIGIGLVVALLVLGLIGMIADSFQ